MKLPVGGDQSMVKSASPNGLMPSMQRPWAKYFSKFINAYAKHGLKMWGVTKSDSAPRYDVGRAANFRQVFGTQLWRWPLPCWGTDGPEGSGYEWPMREHAAAPSLLPEAEADEEAEHEDYGEQPEI